MTEDGESKLVIEKILDLIEKNWLHFWILRKKLIQNRLQHSWPLKKISNAALCYGLIDVNFGAELKTVSIQHKTIY